MDSHHMLRADGVHMSNSDLELYGYCHDCERSIGVATTDEEAAAMDGRHQNETRSHATSWSGDPVEGVHDG